MWFIFSGSVIGLIWMWSIIWGSVVKNRVSMDVDVITPIVDQGDEVILHCRLTNRSWFPCPSIQCVVELPSQLDSGHPDHPSFVPFETYIMPHQEVVVDLRVNSRKRGLGMIQKANFSLTDGIGLQRVAGGIVVRAQIIVRPQQKEPIHVPPRMEALVGDVRTQRFYNEDASLLQGIRPYQPGDPMKYISWYATARTGELMVKEFGHTTTARSLLVLCSHNRTEQPMLDRLCECTVQLADSLLQRRFAVGLYTNLYDSVHRSIYQSPSSDPAQIEIIRNRMGSIEPIHVSNVASHITSLERLLMDGDMVIVLMSDPPTSTFDALERLRRKHSNVLLYALVSEAYEAKRSFGIPTYVEEWVQPIQRLGATL